MCRHLSTGTERDYQLSGMLVVHCPCTHHKGNGWLHCHKGWLERKALLFRSESASKRSPNEEQDSRVLAQTTYISQLITMSGLRNTEVKSFDCQACLLGGLEWCSGVASAVAQDSWCHTHRCNAMQCNAMQCNAMQCNAMQCNAMQCNWLCTYKQLHVDTAHVTWL